MSKIKLLIYLIFISIVSFSQTTEAELCNWAQEKINNNQNEEAIEVLKKCLKENKRSAWAYSIRSIAKRNLGDYKGAIKDLDQAIKISPNYATAYFNKGEILSKSLHLYNEAISSYDKAIEIDKTKEWYYCNRGECKAQLKEYNKAIKDYNKAISINPNKVYIYVNKAVSLIFLKEYSKAIEICDIALKIDSLDSSIYLQMASAFYNLKEYSKACVNVKKSISLGDPIASQYLDVLCEGQ